MDDFTTPNLLHLLGHKRFNKFMGLHLNSYIYVITLKRCPMKASSKQNQMFWAEIGCQLQLKFGGFSCTLCTHLVNSPFFDNWNISSNIYLPMRQKSDLCLRAVHKRCQNFLAVSDTPLPHVWKYSDIFYGWPLYPNFLEKSLAECLT